MDVEQEQEQEKARKKAVLFKQLRCLVALYVGYLGVSLGADVFTGKVSGTMLWVCALAAILFVGGALLILVRDLPGALKR